LASLLDILLQESEKPIRVTLAMLSNARWNENHAVVNGYNYDAQQWC